jgi:hypothetical protein
VAPSIRDAIHLVEGSSAMGWLMSMRVKRGARTDDRLTSGPCDIDPDRHAELRRRWDREVAPGVEWRSLLDLAALRQRIDDDALVVLWGTRAYSNLVWMWWALDALERIGVARSRCVLARPHSDDPFAIVGAFDADEMRDAFAAATEATEDQWREGRELWIKFASPSPLAFDEARRRGSSAWPELTASADLHGAWFPRVIDGRLLLSELDEELLGNIGDGSDEPRKIIGTLPDHRISQLVGMFDAYFHVERLRQWATLGVLEREAGEGMSPYVQDRFRVTDRARALLNDGLEHVSDAPPMYVGGCRVNDPASPWVRIEDDAGWHLALHAD